MGTDRNISTLAPYFTEKKTVHTFSANESISLGSNPDRYSLLISVPIGTIALVTRVAKSPIDDVGVFMFRKGDDTETHGFKFDDDTGPMIITLNDIGFDVTRDVSFRCSFDGYVLWCSEFFYDPSITLR